MELYGRRAEEKGRRAHKLIGASSLSRRRGRGNMSVRNMQHELRASGAPRSLSGLCADDDTDRDALLSDEKRRLLASERRRRRSKVSAEWSPLYSLTCLLVALLVGFSPALMVAAYFLLVEQDPQDGKCSYTPSVNRSTVCSVVALAREPAS